MGHCNVFPRISYIAGLYSIGSRYSCSNNKNIKSPNYFCCVVGIIGLWNPENDSGVAICKMTSHMISIVYQAANRAILYGNLYGHQNWCIYWVIFRVCYLMFTYPWILLGLLVSLQNGHSFGKADLEQNVWNADPPHIFNECRPYMWAHLKQSSSKFYIIIQCPAVSPLEDRLLFQMQSKINSNYLTSEYVAGKAHAVYFYIHQK